MSQGENRAKALAVAGLAHKLLLASELVSEVLKSLDRTCVPCSCCETKLFRNYDQAKVADQLEELPARLERAADRVKNSIDWRDGQATIHSTGYDKVVSQVTQDAASGRQESKS